MPLAQFLQDFQVTSRWNLGTKEFEPILAAAAERTKKEEPEHLEFFPMKKAQEKPETEKVEKSSAQPEKNTDSFNNLAENQGGGIILTGSEPLTEIEAQFLPNKGSSEEEDPEDPEEKEISENDDVSILFLPAYTTAPYEIAFPGQWSAQQKDRETNHDIVRYPAARNQSPRAGKMTKIRVNLKGYEAWLSEIENGHFEQHEKLRKSFDLDQYAFDYDNFPIDELENETSILRRVEKEREALDMLRINMLRIGKSLAALMAHLVKEFNGFQRLSRLEELHSLLLRFLRDVDEKAVPDEDVLVLKELRKFRKLELSQFFSSDPESSATDMEKQQVEERKTDDSQQGCVSFAEQTPVTTSVNPEYRSDDDNTEKQLLKIDLDEKRKDIERQLQSIALSAAVKNIYDKYSVTHLAKFIGYVRQFLENLLETAAKVLDEDWVELDVSREPFVKGSITCFKYEESARGPHWGGFFGFLLCLFHICMNKGSRLVCVDLYDPFTRLRLEGSREMQQLYFGLLIKHTAIVNLKQRDHDTYEHAPFYDGGPEVRNSRSINAFGRVVTAGHCHELCAVWEYHLFCFHNRVLHHDAACFIPL